VNASAILSSAQKNGIETDKIPLSGAGVTSFVHPSAICHEVQTDEQSSRGSEVSIGIAYYGTRVTILEWSCDVRLSTIRARSEPGRGAS